MLHKELVGGGDIETLVARLSRRDLVSAAERNALQRAAADRRRVHAGGDLAKEGGRPSFSTLLVSGFAYRYNLTESGERQITSIHVPGDFVDLHSFLLQTMDHSVAALSDCEIVTFPHAALRDITERYPHLTRLLWLATLLDGAIHRKWLFVMGRHAAVQHLAHLICELHVRLDSVGLVHNACFIFPSTQADLADAMGISPVHVNRSLQELRRSGLLTWKNNEVCVLDWPGLQQLAQFDPSYLHLVKEPR